MTGFIYIAGSFLTVNRSTCGRGQGVVDNDPHYWTDPPTWGICRNDLRARVKVGDYVFFVLPVRARHPQSIFGYLKVAEIITHLEAFHRPHLESKRMGNKNPNGNIIVDGRGRYNRFDAGEHRHIFDKVKRAYVIGDPKNSRYLDANRILRQAPTFVAILQSIFGRAGTKAIHFISRKGQELSDTQVNRLLAWVDA